MADVFISYAREDKSRADMVANALKRAGYEVFWDSEIPPGQTWADYIEGKLSSAKIAVVLWSEASTKSQWVREEARMGRDRGKLIPVMIDATPAPFGFGEVQAADLSGWTGDENDPRWQRFRGAVDMSVQRAASAPPPAAPPPQPQPSPQQHYYVPPPHVQPQALAGAGVAADSPRAYIEKCFKLYVNGAGRARRSEYWWFALFQFGVAVVCAILDVMLFGINPVTSMPNFVLTSLAWLAFLCPAVSVSARRFHDVGLNGWLVAVGYVLSIIWIGAIFLIVVAILPGQVGPNKYGPDPKAPA